jgi:PTH1 family peptidyl-tRNA hydrolase
MPTALAEGAHMENVFLIVGLGNPGADYARTRHNAGFRLVEKLAAHWRAEWSVERKFQARVARAARADKTVLLAEPQTFMNLSGESVGALVRFYQLPLARVMVAVDDADLPLGEIRLRPGGGTAGHHGLESVTEHLATREYARLRVGIGRKDEARQIAGHVLGKFSAVEDGWLEQVLERAAAQLECWLEAGIQKAMSQFNGAVCPTNDDK